VFFGYGTKNKYNSKTTIYKKRIRCKVLIAICCLAALAASSTKNLTIVRSLLAENEQHQSPNGMIPQAS
jgi:hypothetical protein